MTAKTPTASGISRLLASVGFDRSAVLSEAAGFYVRGDKQAVYVGYRSKDGDKQTALDMVQKYAEALIVAGWPAEVIHLAGPLARVTAKAED